MDNFFSSDSITALDFARFTATFLMTMLAVFGLKERGQRWIGRLGVVGFSMQWLAVMYFPSPFATRLYATLLLTSILVAVFAVRLKSGAALR